MSALDTQEGGSHYKDKAIQPVEYIHANGLGFCEGNVIKYVTRWKDKNGLADLKKARHYIDLLIELESKKPDAERHPMTPNVITWPASDSRIDAIGQNGAEEEAYREYRAMAEAAIQNGGKPIL